VSNKSDERRFEHDLEETYLPRVSEFLRAESCTRLSNVGVTPKIRVNLVKSELTLERADPLT